MIITLVEARAARGGSALLLKLELSDGNGRVEDKKLYISVDDYLKLGKPEEGALTIGEYEKLCLISERYEAKNTGIYLLSFGDNNKQNLARKLVRKGYSKETAEFAAASLERDGGIDELSQIKKRIFASANEKLYGERRIITELCSKGYARERVLRIMDECRDEIDFDANKERLFLRKFGMSEPVPETREEAAKIRALLFRYGY